MSFIEVSGKTVEDAVKAGLKELGKESSEVTIDVQDYGSPGLFGMFGRLARVKLTVKEANPEIDFEMPVFSLDQQPAKKAQKPEKPVKTAPESAPAEKAAKPAQPKPAAAEAKPAQPKPAAFEAKPAQPKPAPAGDTQAKAETAPARKPRPRKPQSQSPRPPRETPAEPMQPSMPMEDFPPLNADELSAEGKTAYHFLSEMTRLMNVDVEIRMRETENHLCVQMIGDTLGVLIGRRGETLDALQYLTSLQVNKGRDDYMRVTLDTEHYRAKREEALRNLAERMANRVRKTGHRVTLEPMNPYERRVLHSALQSSAYVTTHSEGEEPYRRVIITLK